MAALNLVRFPREQQCLFKQPVTPKALLQKRRHTVS